MGKGAAMKQPRRLTTVKATKRERAKRVNNRSLRSALLAGLKARSGRPDLVYNDPSQKASRVMRHTPIKQRAGHPLVRAKGSADPANWKTRKDVEVAVDFSRFAWLPDDWGQGVKPTRKTANSTGGGGGTSTVIVSPDGKVFNHKKDLCK